MTEDKRMMSMLKTAPWSFGRKLEMHTAGACHGLVLM